MTQLIQQIITAAYRKLGVVADGAQPTPTQTANGLEALNDHLLSEQRDGWRLGWYPQTLVSNIAPLRDEDIAEVKLVLSGWLSVDYGIPIQDENLPAQIADAREKLTKRSLLYTECDLGELSRPQGGPWGGPNWL